MCLFVSLPKPLSMEVSRGQTWSCQTVFLGNTSWVVPITLKGINIINGILTWFFHKKDKKPASKFQFLPPNPLHSIPIINLLSWSILDLFSNSLETSGMDTWRSCFYGKLLLSDLFSCSDPRSISYSKVGSLYSTNAPLRTHRTHTHPPPHFPCMYWQMHRSANFILLPHVNVCALTPAR